jgi:hypothetical protein
MPPPGSAVANRQPRPFSDFEVKEGRFLTWATYRLRGANKKMDKQPSGGRRHNLELRTDRSAGRAAREDSCGPA